jgi:RNA polymerase sigma factor (sigma-70 family)
MSKKDEWLSTRTTLLSRLRNWSDERTWEEFFNTYAKMIFRFGIKAGLRDAEAQDVVQETMIAVAKKIPNFKYDSSLGSFKGWLLTIARRKVIDQLRKRRPGEGHSARSLEETSRTSTIQRIPDPAGLGLEVVWDEEWKSGIVEAATERIKRRVNPMHYQIFDMYVVRNWPAERVTRALGVSVDVVYAVKSRVSVLLKREIAALTNNLH